MSNYDSAQAGSCKVAEMGCVHFSVSLPTLLPPRLCPELCVAPVPWLSVLSSLVPASQPLCAEGCDRNHIQGGEPASATSKTDTCPEKGNTTVLKTGAKDMFGVGRHSLPLFKLKSQRPSYQSQLVYSFAPGKPLHLSYLMAGKTQTSTTSVWSIPTSTLLFLFHTLKNSNYINFQGWHNINS